MFYFDPEKLYFVCHFGVKLHNIVAK